MIADNEQYLGVALTRPTQMPDGKWLVTETGKQVIEEAVRTLLMTPIGTKFMLPEYGSRFQEALFEQNVFVLGSLLRTFAKEAIDAWEKRIDFVDGVFKSEEDKVMCTITYRILSSNEVDSFVFPYYKEIKY